MQIPSATPWGRAFRSPGLDDDDVDVGVELMGRWALLVVLAALGCGQLKPMEEVEGGIELGLRRGSAWQTIKVRPPYVIGPTASLRLVKGIFTGMSAGGDLVHINVDRQQALGRGPGRVDMDFESEADTFLIDGVWNGDRVHFRITTDSLRGSLRTTVGYCQYQLDEVLRDGARHGFSICSGLPEETRLEIPMSIQAWLTPSELAVVLLELLTAPPTTSFENRFSL
jgi:hypothetical protein